MFNFFRKKKSDKPKFEIGDIVIVKDPYSPLVRGKIIAFAENIVYIENIDTKNIEYIYKGTFKENAAILDKAYKYEPGT